jgi:putative transposase
MPWQECSPVDLRLRFVIDWQTGFWPMTELCADYRISRKTGYKWIARHDDEGVGGLEDRSRRPHGSPIATDPELVEALVTTRRRHPRWGARKLLAVLRRARPDADWPSRSTACALLKREGLITARPSRTVAGHLPGSAPAPITRVNEVWTTDFKGEFRTGNRRYCYPLTLRDGRSRFVLRCDALLDRTYAATRRRFERAFREYGLPERVRSDNGGPFASPGLGRVSRLSVWWMRLGIVPERIAPGHPEQNGSHEQFHSVLKAHTARPPAAHAEAQQRRFARFCAEYNHDRPHEALDDQPPALWYEPSPRAYPTRLPSVEYEGHLEVRRVSSNGCISWQGEALFIATALTGEDVAFEEINDGLWTIRLGPVVLGRYDARQRVIHPMAGFTEGRSPAWPARACPQDDAHEDQ